MTKTMTRQAALVVVAMMLLVPMVSVMDAGNSDASSTSLIPSDYAYKMTYSTDSSDPNNYTQITGVYKYDDAAGDWVSQTPASNGVDGSFGWDSETGFGPFNMFYAAINVKEHGGGSGQNNDANKMSKVKGHVAFVLDPYDLTKYVGQSTTDSWTMTDYNIMLVIPTVYWYSDEIGNMYISSMKEYPGLPTQITNEMLAYAHTTDGSNPHPYIAIGVYEAYCDDDYGMMSKTGVNPTGSKKIHEFRDTLTKTNDGIDSSDSGQYVIWNYYQWTLFKILSQATIADKNVQNTLGIGKNEIPQTGSTNGQHPYSSGTDIFGKMYLENSWGSMWELLDNIHVDGSEIVRAGSGKNPSSNDSSFTIDGYDYTGGFAIPIVSVYDVPWDIVGQGVASASWDLTSVVSADTSGSGGPSGASGDSYYGHPLAFDAIVCVGGSIGLETKNGLSTWNSNRALNNSSSVLGARLAYFMNENAVGIDSVSIEADSTGYGTVDINSPVTDIVYGTSYAIGPNTITIKDKTATAVPEASNAQFTYSFKGWYAGDMKLTDGSIVTGCSPIVAKFERTTNTYGISWMSQDGTAELENDPSVPYGDAPSYGGTENPTKSGDAQYSYIFAGWNTDKNKTAGIPVGSLPTVSGNATYYAAFSEVLNTYEVTLTSSYGGSLTKNVIENVPYGSAITIYDNELTIIGTTVTANADAANGYHFASWTGVPDEIKGNVTINANFAIDEYTVNFQTSGNGSVSQSSISDVPWGAPITVINEKMIINGTTVTATPDSGYVFDYWSFGNQSVIDEMTVTAVFVVASDYFDVSIKPNDSNYGLVSKTSITNVPYGTKITVSDNVLNIGSDTVTATAKSGYYFIEWSMIPATGKTGNIYEITAAFSSDAPTPGKTYNVGIESNDDSYGTVSKSVVSDVPYGTAISVNGSILTIGSETVAASANEGYYFVEWSMVPPSGIVTSGLALKAVFAADSPVPPGPEPPKPRPTPPTITYTLSFECSPGGTVSQSSVKVPMNSPISISGNVLRVGTGSSMKTIQALPDEGYYVASWSVPSYNVLSDMTVEVSFGKLVLAEISVHIPPVKLSYKEGETFDPTGLVLLLKYADGSIRFLDYKGHESEIAFDKSISTPLEESDKTVKITYEGKNTYQDITVSSEKTDDGFLLWLIIGLIAIVLLIIFILLFRRRGEQTQS